MVDLIVETGAGILNANAYDTLENVSLYHVNHGNTDWDPALSPTDEQEAAIIRASAYLDRKYGSRYPGTKVLGRAQSLAWPRKDATDVNGETIEDDEVPTEIKKAVAEAALREFLEPGSLSPDYVNTAQVTSETLGPLSVSYAVSQTTSVKDTQPVVTVIDDIMATLLKAPVSLLFGEKATL